MHRGIRVFMAVLPDGMCGCADPASGTVWLAHGLLQRERRDTLTHELVHLERGAPVAGFEDHEEHAVDAEVARRLIPIGALCDALRWTRDVTELAEELDCAEDSVRLRLATITDPAEVAAVAAALADVEQP